MNIRLAATADTQAIGELLFAFNTEYNDPTPPPEQLSQRFKTLLDDDHIAVMLAGDGPDGLAVLKFSPSLWSEGQECYIAELYVKPELRGQGIGRQLMDAVVAHAQAKGADYIHLGTSEDDVAARKLYESCGFTNQEGEGGPIMYVYEREL